VRPDLPTGTVTFVFTDVEGSPLLNESGAQAYADALADRRAVIREACMRKGGVVSPPVAPVGWPIHWRAAAREGNFPLQMAFSHAGS
jgi:hypothetical protein